jgi:hypothetical protein
VCCSTCYLARPAVETTAELAKLPGVVPESSRCAVGTVAQPLAVGMWSTAAGWGQLTSCLLINSTSAGNNRGVLLRLHLLTRLPLCAWQLPPPSPHAECLQVCQWRVPQGQPSVAGRNPVCTCCQWGRRLGSACGGVWSWGAVSAVCERNGLAGVCYVCRLLCTLPAHFQHQRCAPGGGFHTGFFCPPPPSLPKEEAVQGSSVRSPFGHASSCAGKR